MLPSTLDRTWLVVGRRTLSGHVCHSAHHFGGAQRSTRGGSASTSSSTTGKVDTSCPTTSVIPVQAGCTAPPARRSHHAATADAADAGPEPTGVHQARAARSSRPAGPPTGHPDVRRPTRSSPRQAGYCCHSWPESRHTDCNCRA